MSTPGGGDGGDGIDIPLPGLGSPTDDTPASSRPRGPGIPSTGRSGAPLPEASTVDPRFSEKLFQTFTGRTGATRGDVRGQLITAFGASPRDPNRPDTAEAARRLGVSQRSVQRWLKGGGVRPQTQAALTRRARQAMTTKRGRARALAQSTFTRPPGRRGQGLIIGGWQGVVSSVDDNYRDRDTGVQLSTQDLEALQDTWVEHGQDGAIAWLHQHWDSHYTDGWHFRDIDDIGWGPTQNY